MEATEQLPDSRPHRVASIDVLRGITIMAMIFVNDIAGVHGTPAWLKHFKEDGDGMTVTDCVFPAFLFIVGMSLPFSIGRQMDSGVPLWRIVARILGRTASLLIVGVFMVNSPSDEGILNPDVWHLLMYTCVILAWNRSPAEPGRKRTIILTLRAVGIVGLIALAILYRGHGPHRLIELQTEWWGIIGLIGWAYLVAALSFVATRRNAIALTFVAIALYGLFIISRLGWIDGAPFGEWVDYGSMLGSQGALSVSGAALAIMLTPQSKIRDHSKRLAIAATVGCVAALSGHLLHMLRDVNPMFIINKNIATVPWCLWCTAWTVWVWAIIYFVVDVKGWKSWATFIRPAGENPLLAYLIAPIVYAGFSLLGQIMGGYDIYAMLGANLVTGAPRAILFALGATWLTGAAKPLGVNPGL
ncbi:lpg1661 family Dot/Icm T4SS effector [soil metagenome]